MSKCNHQLRWNDLIGYINECVICGVKLCESKNMLESRCMLENRHPGRHKNINSSISEWTTEEQK